MYNDFLEHCVNKVDTMANFCCSILYIYGIFKSVFLGGEDEAVKESSTLLCRPVGLVVRYWACGSASTRSSLAH